tara:strand:- start:822 stop:2810 length:1989 start_codon:yes stop_codon:yes gene_type:complete
MSDVISDIIANFHLLRPFWLLLLPLILLLGIWLWRQQAGANQWQTLIRPELLQHLLERRSSSQSRWPLLALLCGWSLAVLALAGPTWERLPQPLYSKQDALVLILDLSPSMMAQDLKPDRLTHAKHRLTDLIKARHEGQTGLVVYAGDAHLLAPISDDRQTLLTLVPGLSPGIMPVKGSQAEDAIETALRLLRDAGHSRGQILLITDGVTATASEAIRNQLRDQPYRLSILGIGTAEGAPIPLRDGSFAKNAQGVIQLAKLEPHALAALARAHAGIYQPLSYDGSDIKALMAQLEQHASSDLDSDSQQKLEREFDLWHEAGPWLVLLLLPLAALSHRRGWLLSLLILLPSLTPEPAQAFEWQTLWQTPDQQAQQRFQEGDNQGAAERFETPEWRGSALYRSGQFEPAAEAFGQSDSARAHYNRGNALARDGKLDQALAAFTHALERDPGFDDARFNQQLVEKLIEQQKQEQEQQQDSDSESSENSDSEPGSDAEQNPGDSENADSNAEQSGQSSDAQQGSESNPDNRAPADAEASQSDSQPSPQQPPSEPQNDAQDSESDPSSSAQNNDATAEATKATEDQTQASSQAEAAQPEGETEPKQSSAGATEAETQPSSDPRLDRWLQQLPDDPSGLLRRKFEYQYQQKLDAYRQGQWQPPKESRW